jgi:DNA-binding XRE family transcriptional regulator
MAETAQEKKYTISQAAKRIGVSKRTIQRWIKSKKIPFQIDPNGIHLLNETALLSKKPLTNHQGLMATPLSSSSLSSGLLSAALAAKSLGISKRTLLRWEKAGLITPTRTVGGARRYNTKDITALSSSRIPYQRVPKIPETLVSDTINIPPQPPPEAMQPTQEIIPDSPKTGIDTIIIKNNNSYNPDHEKDKKRWLLCFQPFSEQVH